VLRKLLPLFAPCCVIVTGCYTTVPVRTDVELRVEDGPIWVEPDDIPRYRCVDGILVCTDSGGRVTKRWCRCSFR
jgi:hypothetical protein